MMNVTGRTGRFYNILSSFKALVLIMEDSSVI